MFWVCVGVFSILCQLIVLLTFKFGDFVVKEKADGGKDMEMRLIDNNHNTK